MLKLNIGNSYHVPSIEGFSNQSNLSDTTEEHKVEYIQFLAWLFEASLQMWMQRRSPLLRGHPERRQLVLNILCTLWSLILSTVLERGHHNPCFADDNTTAKIV